MIDPRFIECERCGTKLQLSPKWRRFWWGSLLGAVVLVVISVFLRHIFGWGGLINVFGFLLLAVVYSRLFWLSAVYQIKPRDVQPPSDLELP
jgi:hypothetical protein